VDTPLHKNNPKEFLRTLSPLGQISGAKDIAQAVFYLTEASQVTFQVKVVGLRKSITTARGLSVPVIAAARAQTPDAVVMPAILHMRPEPLVQALAGSEMREAGAVLRKWAGRGALIATACIGTFVLAEAALLDGEEATTTWWLSPLFRQRYPRVRLDESRIIVQSNAVVTAGAALSHLDLALALIRRASPELANVTARYLVVDERTSQSIYSIPDHLAKADPLIQQFERWARGRLAEGFSLDQVATEVGYAEGVTLRALLRRRLGRGVREIRRSS
jgi:transcriptional regulator GlxA family with amidase domain